MKVQTNKQLTDRWGQNVIAHGWTAFPNLMFELCARLKIKRGDIYVLLAIESHRWTTANPFPSVSTIAKLSDFSEREVYRALNRLERAGLVLRRHTNKKSNEYDNEPLLQQLDQLSNELNARPNSHGLHDGKVLPVLSYASDEEDQANHDIWGEDAQQQSFLYSQEAYDQAITIAELFQRSRGGIVYRDKWETDMVEELIINEGYSKVLAITKAVLRYDPDSLCYSDDPDKAIATNRPIKLCDNWHALLNILDGEY